MSPRNQDDANCKSDHFTGESEDSQCFDFTPNILHKKHKVIKLVKAQLLNLQEGGILDSINNSGNEYGKNQCVDFTLDVTNDDDTEDRVGRMTLHPEYLPSGMEMQSNEPTSPLLWLVWLVLLLTTIFIMVMLSAWLSTGPLSSRAPHTPIHWSSLVKTDGVCELERKYLLRWSTSNYME